MRAAYFDCFSGISGDMVLGALVDLGWPVEELKRELDKLDLFGYRIEAKKVAKRGILSTQIKIRTKEEKKGRTLGLKCRSRMTWTNFRDPFLAI